MQTHELARAAGEPRQRRPARALASGVARAIAALIGVLLLAAGIASWVRHPWLYPAQVLGAYGAVVFIRSYGRPQMAWAKTARAFARSATFTRLSILLGILSGLVDGVAHLTWGRPL